MVDCAFSDPNREDAWNEYYTPSPASTARCHIAASRACVSRAEGERLAQAYNGIVRLYAPMMAQRVKPANK